MNNDTVRSVLQGNIEALDQGLQLLEQLTDEQYIHIASPYVKSSIGQHFRHIADVFLAVTSADDNIDYDVRRRGAEVERSRLQAKRELEDIKSVMEGYLKANATDSSLLVQTKQVKTEVTINETQSVVLASTTLRELVFASSHAVHHFALISVIAKLQDVSLEGSIGIAPATATFLRQENQVVDKQSECAQ